MLDDPPPRPLMPGRLFYARTFAVLTLAVLGYLVFEIVAPFLAPIAWAAIIAFLVEPLHARLTGRLGERRNLSASLMLIAALLFILVPLAALGIAFAAQAADLLRGLQEATAGGDRTLHERLLDSAAIGALLDWLQGAFGVAPADVSTWIERGLRNALEFMLALGGRAFLGAVATATNFAVMLFVLFFMIRDGRTILASLADLIPLSAERTERLFEHIGLVMRDVVFGTVLTALAQGALVGAAFAIVGIDAPVVLGAITALFALLPVGGPSIVWVPAAIVLAVDDRWAAALFLTAWGLLLVATIDNVLRPLLVSRRGHVATLTVFIGVIGGGAAFGLIGLLIGPVILAFALAVLAFTVELRRAETGSS